jgi:tryptophanyl-tRNA synthetase
MLVKYEPENKPGISNLINIYASLTGKEIAEIESEFEGANYGTFKTKVADVVISELEKIQIKYNGSLF